MNQNDIQKNLTMRINDHDTNGKTINFKIKNINSLIIMEVNNKKVTKLVA